MTQTRKSAGRRDGGQFGAADHDESDVEIGREPVPPFTVEKVVDTRDLIEVGERFVRVPGSGEQNICDRCGAKHEIHATITDSTGGSFVVGVSCMDADAAKSARRMVNRAQKEGVAAAVAARKARAQAELDELSAQVGELSFPAADVVDHDTSGGFGPVMSVGGARVFGQAPRPNSNYYRPGEFDRLVAEFRAERLQMLEKTWKEHELAARMEAIVGAERLAELRKHSR